MTIRYLKALSVCAGRTKSFLRRNKMRVFGFYCIGLTLLALCSTAHATTFTFDTDPFAGTNVLNTPGRQIVAGEDFINFNIATDVFALDSSVFGVGNTVNFVNSLASAIPASGVNVVVLESFDNDNNPQTPFGAGNAADLIAGQITTSGPGFFVYFNQALDLPRLVYSTDLSSTSADLKVLGRMINLTGAEGRNEMPNFSAANFEFTAATPEPSSLLLVLAMSAIAGCCIIVRRNRAQGPSGEAS
jgi:hypothetical protein